MTSYNKDLDQNEYYMKNDGIEQYVNRDGKQIYAKKKDKKEFYAKDKKGNPYYAKSENSEYYAKGRHKKDIPITIGTLEIYAKDSKSADIYPTDSDGKEFALKKDGHVYYATDENQIEQYPKDKSGDEYIVNNILIKTREGKRKLPLLKNGNPKYEKKANGEIYPLDDNKKPYFCKNRDGDEVYAKNEHGDEYYPPNMYAKNRHGEFYYAVDRSKIISYPRNSIGETYIETKEGSYPLLKNLKNTFVYAKQKTREIYPTLYVNNKKMEMIVDVYATVFNDGPYYPIDTDLNEYTLPDGECIVTKGYPMTIDGYIIIPNVNNEPKLMPNNNNVSKENISKLLYRPGWRGYDFLTNVKSIRKAKGSVANYKTIDLKSGNKSLLYYVIAALTLIIIILVSVL